MAYAEGTYEVGFAIVCMISDGVRMTEVPSIALKRNEQIAKDSG